MTASEPVRWGFLGAGRIATHALAPAVAASDGAQLQAVAARDRLRAQALRPSGNSYDDYRQLLSDPAVEAVYLSLHNSGHFPWVIEALAAGKHVLCEKPLGCTADEVRQMAEAAERTGLLLVEATWYRWHPRTRRMLELIADLGPASRVQADFCFGEVPADDFRLDPAFGGGALADVGCYAVSAAQLFLQASSFTVKTASMRMSASGVDLAATAELIGGTGVARIRCGIDEIERQGVVVTCHDAILEMVSPPFTSWHSPAQIKIRRGESESVEQFPEVDPYRLMIEAVSGRIRGGDDWLLPLTESLIVAQTLDNIRSHESN